MLSTNKHGMFLFTDIDDVKMKNISVSGFLEQYNYGKMQYKKSMPIYDYNGIKQPLYILVKNIKLNGCDYNDIPGKPKYNAFYINRKINADFINTLKNIRSHIVENYVYTYNNFDVDNINKLRDVNNPISLYYKNNMLDITKLGSKSENFVNTKIENMYMFHNYISNKNNNYFKYIADIILEFNVTAYRKYSRNNQNTENWKLSFKPVIKKMEFKLSKSITKSNTNDNIFISNNILSI